MPALRLSSLLLALAWHVPPSAPARAQEGACRAAGSLPGVVRPFVEAGACAIALEGGDLDRDGRADYLLVLERSDTAPSRSPTGGAARCSC